MTILKQNSTHVAIDLHNGLIAIRTKGLVIEDLTIEPEHLYNIQKCDQDDLFAIFEDLDETNRINLNEFNA